MDEKEQLVLSKEESKKKKASHNKVSFFSQALNDLAAGAVAGALAKTTIAPLDMTKINFQTQNKPFGFAEGINFIKNTYKNYGFLSLWRGNSATMARVIPYAAIQYCAHENFKRILEVETNEQKRKNPSLTFVAGSLAGIVSTTLTYPLDLARARMAVTQKHQYNSLKSVFVMTIREEGFFKLYKGYLATLLGVAPYSGTSFFTYETLKRIHCDMYPDRELFAIEYMLFGAFAGLLSQSASYPLDIVRRRMQTKKGYDSIRYTIIKVVSEEGILQGLYKGLSLNWIKGPIAVGISFTTFDIVKKFLAEPFENT